jgi:hypothetical protein
VAAEARAAEADNQVRRVQYDADFAVKLATETAAAAKDAKDAAERRAAAAEERCRQAEEAAAGLRREVFEKESMLRKATDDGARQAVAARDYATNVAALQVGSCVCWCAVEGAYTTLHGI